MKPVLVELGSNLTNPNFMSKAISLWVTRISRTQRKHYNIMRYHGSNNWLFFIISNRASTFWFTSNFSHSKAVCQTNWSYRVSLHLWMEIYIIMSMNLEATMKKKTFEWTQECVLKNVQKHRNHYWEFYIVTRYHLTLVVFKKPGTS